jgi:hypothetical protein
MQYAMVVRGDCLLRCQRRVGSYPQTMGDSLSKSLKPWELHQRDQTPGLSHSQCKMRLMHGWKDHYCGIEIRWLLTCLAWDRC